MAPDRPRCLPAVAFATNIIPMPDIELLWMEEKWLRDLVAITLAFLIAYIIHLFAGRIAGRMVRLNRFRGERRRPRQERLRTLQDLFSSTISFLSIVGAILYSISRFVDNDTLVWVVGLFSAAFGLGARPLVNDVLAGISFIFEDTFDVGEKVEMMGVEGVIERVTLRVTLLRAPTGELFVAPNGDIRLVRNFSRGRFSSSTIKLTVRSEELSHALRILDDLAEEAVLILPNLLEPWQILSESGAIGETTELTLLTKARFGHGAEMRPRLLALVQERLSEEGVGLVD